MLTLKNLKTFTHIKTNMCPRAKIFSMPSMNSWPFTLPHARALVQVKEAATNSMSQNILKPKLKNKNRNPRQKVVRF